MFQQSICVHLIITTLNDWHIIRHLCVESSAQLRLSFPLVWDVLRTLRNRGFNSSFSRLNFPWDIGMTEIIFVPAYRWNCATIVITFLWVFLIRFRPLSAYDFHDFWLSDTITNFNHFWEKKTLELLFMRVVVLDILIKNQPSKCMNCFRFLCVQYKIWHIVGSWKTVLKYKNFLLYWTVNTAVLECENMVSIFEVEIFFLLFLIKNHKIGSSILFLYKAVVISRTQNL